MAGDATAGRPLFATWTHRRLFSRGDTLGDRGTRAQEPAMRSPTAARRRMTDLNRRTDLLEREAELEQIGDALGTSAAGSGRIVVIEGAPGIGKSSLLGRGRGVRRGGADGRSSRARRRDGARVRARRSDPAAGADASSRSQSASANGSSQVPRDWRARCSRRFPTEPPRKIACSHDSTACTGCAQGWPRSGRSPCSSTMRTGPTSIRFGSSPTWRRGSRRSRPA